MGRVLLVFLFATSLLASGQTIVVSQPGQSPIPATPTATLPGSGTPSGAPPMGGVNDGRTGGSGAVYQPNYAAPGGYLVTTPTATAETVNPMPPAPGDNFRAADPNKGTGYGVQSFQSDADSKAAAPAMSLAQAAAQYKQQRESMKSRTFMNGDLYALKGNPGAQFANGEMSLPQNDDAGTAAGENIQPSGDTTGVLNPRDLAEVERALARSRINADQDAAVNNASGTENVEMARARLPESDEAADESTQPAANQPAADRRAANAASQDEVAADRLPASSSSLPLIAFLGCAAIAIGVSYRLIAARSRK